MSTIGKTIVEFMSRKFVDVVDKLLPTNLQIVRHKLENCSWIRTRSKNTKVKRLYIFRFLGCDDPDSFFSRAQRSRICWEILATAPFGKEKKGEVGVERLVDEGAFSAAFPLHDVSVA